MARTRNRRRRGQDYTGVLRGNRAQDERTMPSQIEERGGFRWRIVSAIIILMLSGLLALFFYSDVFYVSNIRVSGAEYIGVEEVFALAQVANYHVFWLEPETVRQNVLQYPLVADANVQIGWPPHMVTITIAEREPALIWEQNGVAYWIDIQGNVMQIREDRDDLVRIVVDDPLVEVPLGSGRGLDDEVVIGVLQLHDLRPDVTAWRYDPARGLGYRNPNGWDVWFGVGGNMAERMKIYETVGADVIARGMQLSYFNVANPDAPYYKVIWGR